MEERGGYGQFCPVSMASEILCSRWTTLVVRELLCGSTRFNDLRRGLPKMSPALLSKRLKELQRAGVITVSRKANGSVEYHLSEAGEELRPLIMGLGNWAQRWMEFAAFAEEPRPVAADVGHAPEPQRQAAARPRDARYSFCTRSWQGRRRAGGWWWKAARSTSAISIPATSSTSSSKARCDR